MIKLQIIQVNIAIDIAIIQTNGCCSIDLPACMNTIKNFVHYAPEMDAPEEMTTFRRKILTILQY